jgi:hypothetical protein
MNAPDIRPIESRIPDILPDLNSKYERQVKYKINKETCYLYNSGWLDIRPFLLSGFRPDIRQLKSGIRPDNGFQKRPDYPAGYPVYPYIVEDQDEDASLFTLSIVHLFHHVSISRLYV